MLRTILVRAAFGVIAGAAASASVLGGVAAADTVSRTDTPSLTSSVASDGYAIGGHAAALAGYAIGGHAVASEGYGIGGHPVAADGYGIGGLLSS